MSLGNIMNRSNPGERYLMGDLMGPDARFVDDMNLLNGAVRIHAAENPENPFVQEQVKAFTEFRSGLGWHDCYVIPNDTFEKAWVQYQEVERALGDRFGGEESSLSSVSNWIFGADQSIWHDILNRSDAGSTSSYHFGDFLGADKRFTEDLDKLDEYVRSHARPLVAKFPHSESAIVDYEHWRQGLGWWDYDFKPNDTMQAALSKIGAIQKAQNEALASNAIAPPGKFVVSPEDPGSTGKQLKTATKIVAGIAGVILILLGVRAVRRGAGSVIISGYKRLASSETGKAISLAGQTAASKLESAAKTVSSKLSTNKTG